MSTSLNILIIEDSADDAALLVDALESSGFAPKWKRVQREADYLPALNDELDVIFSDFTLPQFTVKRALELLKQTGFDIPFIIVSGTIGEERAVESLKAGATDYILKNRMHRLALAVERARQERAQRKEKTRFEEQLLIQATALENAASTIFITSSQGVIQWVNPAFTALTGYAADEVIGRTPRVLKSGKHDEAFYQNFWQTILSGQIWRGEFINRRQDGKLYHGEQTVAPVRSQEGTITHFVAIMNDMSARKEAEASLKMFRTLIDRSNDGVEVIDPETGRFLDVNERSCQEHGYTREEMLAMGVPQIEETPIDQAEWLNRMRKVRKAGSKTLQAMHRRKDGSVFPVEVNSKYITLDRDYIVAVVRNITERKKVETELQQSQELFRELAENIREVFWIVDIKTDQILYVSPAYETVWGRPREQIYSNSTTFIEAVHLDDRPAVLSALENQKRTGLFKADYRVVRPDGSVRFIHDRGFPIKDEKGQIYRIAGLAEDVTERIQLETQFRQSQKMEAIGQLAGGVAHDFNNILAAMTLQAELMAMEQNIPAAVQEGLWQIRVYAERAANLTRQLLLFSRRQVMQPRDMDVNQALANLAKMLQRIIGEDVRLQLHLHPASLTTRADPGMFDQVLMNLAVNARDAMPSGGRLLIESAEKTVDEDLARLHPDLAQGRYAWVSVSDTGTGIPAEILPRIFEPFFTTKEPGKGTGLGLATVFGILKQHNGWIKVYSEPGKGANFQVFFPISESEPNAISRTDATRLPRGGTETILVVEDESSVRMLTRMILERSGYRVLEASHGVQAIQVWNENSGNIDLLLTDMVMPEGLGGRELALRLKKEKPALKVIFTSGYSAEIAKRELVLEKGQDFIQKPCPAFQMLETVRRCLDG